MNYVQEPRDVIQMNKFVTLTVDATHVNNFPFVITYGRGIGLITAEFMPNQRAYQFTCNLKRIISSYSRARFTIQTIIIDMEINKVTLDIPEVIVNTSTASESELLKKGVRPAWQYCLLKEYQMS